MDKNQHQEVSFEQLVEMANFNLDEEPTKTEDVIITLEQEETPPPTLEIPKEEVIQETPDEEVSIKDLNNQNNFYSYVKDRIESGDLDDVILNIDGEEKKLSELDFLDEETYKAVLEDDKKFKEEEFKSKYVSVENLTDTQKTLIDIIKSGDLDKAKELFDNPQNLVEPFQGYDSDNESHQEQVLRWFYTQQGNSQKEVEALIKVAKEDLTLDSKADKIVNFQREQFKLGLEEESKKLQQAKLEEQEKIKTYRKELSKEFKSTGLDENVIKKYVDISTKYTKDGDLEIDTIYQKLMDNPKEAMDLIHFMLDKDNFLKTKTSEIKKDVQKNMLRQISIIRDTAKTNTSISTKEEPKSDLEKLTFN